MDSGDRPLHVLHLTAGSDAGGLSRYIHDLSSAMTAAGHSVAVAGERGAWHGMFESASFPWVDAPLKGNLYQLWKASRSLSTWIEGHPVDLLHVHYRRCALVGRMIQRSHSIPMLYTLHLSDLSLRWPRRLLSDFGDHTHAASVDGRRWLTDRAGVPADLITTIPHGIDADQFPLPTVAGRAAARLALGLSPVDRVAVFVGRLDYPKNADWLLDLAVRTAGENPPLMILLVGDGPDRDGLRRRIDAEQLGDRVKLLGHGDPLPTYHAADAVLLPSLREGFSLVFAEAMATGLPVLRTRTAGATEMIVEGVTGRSVDIDRQAFVGAAAAFMRDTERLKEMGDAAASLVRTRFTFHRQLRETVGLYRRLVRGPE